MSNNYYQNVINQSTDRFILETNKVLKKYDGRGFWTGIIDDKNKEKKHI